MNTARSFQSLLLSLLLFAVMVITTGCPYGAAYPLEGSKVPYNPDLVGAWHGDKKELRITRITADRFKVYYNSHDEKDGVELNGEGYCIKKNGADYLVVKDLALQKYYLAQIVAVEKNTFSVKMLEDEHMGEQTFVSSKDLTEKVMANSDKWFDEPVVYTRDNTPGRK